VKLSEKIAPVAAVTAALSTLLCCLPLGFLAMAGVTAGFGAALSSYRPWLLGAAALFLGFGLFQMYRARGTCQRRSRVSIVLYCMALVVVGGVALFPQAVAGFLADIVPYSDDPKTPANQPKLADLDTASVAGFVREFNDAADRERIILLLSPT
jgi:hypothetical protein